MGKSVARSHVLLYALRFALVVVVCLVFGLLLGYSAGGAVAWLGKRFAARPITPPSSGHVGLGSRLGVQTAPQQNRAASGTVTTAKAASVIPDEGALLPSVRDGTHSQPDTLTHWDYCGNPQCRLCYPVDQPVAPAFASDTGLPDMPQGYCKRHPQDRYCKPIVAPPSPKPLPKATDPPVVASAGLGPERFVWGLMLVLFVGLCVTALDAHGLRRELAASERLLGRREVEASEVRQIVQSWLDKQEHDRCWYYPELFRELASALDLRPKAPPGLPTLAEFRVGCERFQREEYPEKPIGVLMHDSGDSRRGTPASLTHDGQVVFVRRRPELRDIKLNISFDKPKAQEPSEGKHLPVARPIRVSAGHIPESARCDGGDLCTLHKPCAKHDGKPGQPIGDVEAETRLQSNNSDERGIDSAKC